jgi:hypothetical protein
MHTTTKKVKPVHFQQHTKIKGKTKRKNYKKLPQNTSILKK